MDAGGLSHVAALRKEYADHGLSEDEVAASPFDQFAIWYDEFAAAGVAEPNAMVLATATPDGRPSARMVLLKGFSESGFVFFSNMVSRKGRELAANPRAALLFPWHPIERQVRVDGPCTLLPREDVDAYFASRPRRSQLGAWASRQSSPVTREELAQAFAEADAAHPDSVPTPSDWGGWLVQPETVEFWQGRPGRMHDRVVYTRSGDGWQIGRLAP